VLRNAYVRLVASLVAASALCLLTLELRIHRTGDDFYNFLVLNLLLAWLPLAFGAAAYVVARRRVTLTSIVFLVLWLLFFPNAPYVLTDFIHLGSDGSRAPLWYDALMLSAFAWTALLLGFISLYLVHAVIDAFFGAAWAWAVVVFAFALGSFGVYLGRFVRFNSWDALLRPGRVGQVISHQLENPLHHPRLVATLVVLTAFLLVGYAVVYTFADAHLKLRGDRLLAPSPKG
jgi:uncharacterized membrane protein